MFKTLRNKLLVGLAPLLAIVLGLGLWAVVMFARLGGNIDLILRENYRSVRYAERMKEALERMDSAVLFALAGEEIQARAQFDENRPRFAEALADENANITLHSQGEAELAAELTRLFARYEELAERYFALPPGDARRAFYFGQLYPTFQRIKDRADDVLRINQQNMEDMDARARAAAANSIRLMILALLGAACVGVLASVALSRLILGPIRDVTRAAREMARGDYDQVVPVVTHDELGELAEAFNVMARRIREYQAAGTAKLLRAQQTAQATIDSFPDPVVVIDPSGAVERANPSARRILGAIPGDGAIPWTAPASLRQALREVLEGRPDYLPAGVEQAVAFRDDGQERFYMPRVLAIRQDGGLIGAAVVLQEVTKFRLIDQLKSDMVSTVSHELKTPLTSLQMAVHLLLEEVVGPLSPKQVELLLAARQDAERLLAMVNDLLDLTRIEQGRIRLDLSAARPADLVAEALERFAAQARDAGVALETDVGIDLPTVLVDRERVDHVFDNLIANALRHTPRGGIVRVSAGSDRDRVRFAVSDTGEGIAPEHLPRIFEKFYRVPGDGPDGAGLGLAITREIVRAHGGEIDVESRLGRGTTFSFWLPAAPASEPGSARGIDGVTA
jgi:NtrC-family two-component system sensor histidine kinase KinB